jgi:hypothetical protein
LRLRVPIRADVAEAKFIESEEFVNVAVLQGDEIKIIDDQSEDLPDCPALLSSLLGLYTQHASDERGSMLVRLEVSMRAHGRGRLVLVVPSQTEQWRKSLVHLILYALTPPFSALAELTRERPPRKQDRRWIEAVRHAVDGVAGLTAVDGATLRTDTKCSRSGQR